MCSISKLPFVGQSKAEKTVSSDGERSASPVKDGSVSPDRDKKDSVERGGSQGAEDVVDNPPDGETSVDEQPSDKDSPPTRDVPTSPKNKEAEEGNIYE